MKPLTRYEQETINLGLGQIGVLSMCEDENGRYYRKDEADARFAELESKLAFVESERDSLCGVLTAARDILKAELERERARSRELEAENLHTENLYAREIERRKDAEAERAFRGGLDAAIDAARRTE